MSMASMEPDDWPGLFARAPNPVPDCFCELALYAGDLALVRFHLQELAKRLAAEERRTSLREDHTATDLPTETRRAIQCVVQDHLTPAIDDLLRFMVRPLDDDPGEVS